MIGQCCAIQCHLVSDSAADWVRVWLDCKACLRWLEMRAHIALRRWWPTAVHRPHQTASTLALPICQALAIQYHPTLRFQRRGPTTSFTVGYALRCSSRQPPLRTFDQKKIEMCPWASITPTTKGIFVFSLAYNDPDGKKEKKYIYQCLSPRF